MSYNHRVNLGQHLNSAAHLHTSKPDAWPSYSVAVIQAELHAPPLYLELKKHVMNNSKFSVYILKCLLSEKRERERRNKRRATAHLISNRIFSFGDKKLHINQSCGLIKSCCGLKESVEERQYFQTVRLVDSVTLSLPSHPQSKWKKDQ